MQVKKDFREKLNSKFAEFKRSIRQYKVDIEKLINNMLLLQKYNLSEMNDRLIQQAKIKQFLEMLTEINFTAGLLRSNNNISNSNIFYERVEEKNNSSC